MKPTEVFPTWHQLDEHMERVLMKPTVAVRYHTGSDTQAGPVRLEVFPTWHQLDKHMERVRASCAKRGWKVIWQTTYLLTVVDTKGSEETQRKLEGASR